MRIPNDAIMVNTTITLLTDTYTLTIGDSGNDDATTGDLNLTNTTGTTPGNGTGQATTIIDASGMPLNGRDGVLSINAGVTV